MDDAFEELTTSSGAADAAAQTEPLVDSGNKKDRVFTLWDRLKIWAISVVGYLAALLIGRSLRWTVMGWEIFSATWFWRQRGIVVMTSQNFDGEYIARIIQKHGYGAARGSSSRGATRALKEMIRTMQRGNPTA